MGTKNPNVRTGIPQSVPIWGHGDRKTPVWGQDPSMGTRNPNVTTGIPQSVPIWGHGHRKTPIWGQDPRYGDRDPQCVPIWGQDPLRRVHGPQVWGQGPPECPYMGTWGQKDPNMGTGPPKLSLYGDMGTERPQYGDRTPRMGTGTPNCPYMGTERPQYGDKTPSMGTRNPNVRTGIPQSVPIWRYGHRRTPEWGQDPRYGDRDPQIAPI